VARVETQARWRAATEEARAYGARGSHALAARAARAAHAIAEEGGAALLTAVSAAHAALHLALAGEANRSLRILAGTEVKELTPDGRDDPEGFAARLAPLIAREGEQPVLLALGLRAKAFAALGLASLAEETRAAIRAIAPGADEAPCAGALSYHESRFVQGVRHLSRERFWAALPHLAAAAGASNADDDPGGRRAALAHDARSGVLLAGWMALGELLIEGGCDRGARWLAEEALVNGLPARAEGRPAGALPDVACALMVMAFLEDEHDVVLAAAPVSALEALPHERWQGALGARMATAAAEIAGLFEPRDPPTGPYAPCGIEGLDHLLRRLHGRLARARRAGGAAERSQSQARRA